MLTHADNDPSTASIRPASVRSEHVVQHQNVAVFPRKNYRFLCVSRANSFQGILINRRAVAIVCIAWWFPARRRQQRFAYFWRQTGNVEEMSLIKPNLFARLWMRRYSLADLARAQLVFALPFVFDTCLTAVSLDLRTICRLKNVPPRKIQRVAIVSHVHHVLFNEPISDSGIDRVENIAAVGNRSLTAFG